MKKAAICTIGDEILIGQIIDTNSSHIAKALNTLGIRVSTMTSIGDERDQILGQLNQLLQEHDLIITTGGLGPTKDDITKRALGELYGSTSTYEHPQQAAVVRNLLTCRGVPLFQSNLDQAVVPTGCEVLVNQLGTAPGLVFRFPQERYSHCPTLYSLPGVPFEAIGLLDSVLHDIQQHQMLVPIVHKTWSTFGIAESTLSEMIADWEDHLPENFHLAYLPNTINGVRLRLSCYGAQSEDTLTRIEQEFEKIRPILGTALYSQDETSLPEAVGQLLRSRSATVATAESCTCGRVAHLLGSIPGASKYLFGGTIAYSNSVKINQLKVPTETINKDGAVSQQCVESMARGTIELYGTTYAVASSGIAGPGGGTKEKPVGLVWIAVASRLKDGTIKTIAQSFNFRGDRERNMERFAANAINLLRLAMMDTCI
ncbi:MAG: CinA family nicotinamide mononucleotide deamidase-related protein [Bacteroidales bacterium]|nr:CinA family nicotinamide mononucleotide deamidase-related protein [Bacteroidales bacterium]